MSFREERYAKFRPFLYHVTRRHNMKFIAAMRKLQSAATWLNVAKQKYSITSPRRKPLPLTVNEHHVILNDQASLHEKNARFPDGWSALKFARHLDRYVFFWSGRARGPVKSGIRFFERYEHQDMVIIRAPFGSLRKQNNKSKPLFCRYNSGSPRWSNNRPSPRDPEIFAPAKACGFTAGMVKEVVFRDFVVLPDDTERANSVDGPWRRLWGRLPNKAL